MNMYKETRLCNSKVIEMAEVTPAEGLVVFDRKVEDNNLIEKLDEDDMMGDAAEEAKNFKKLAKIAELKEQEKEKENKEKENKEKENKASGKDLDKDKDKNDDKKDSEEDMLDITIEINKNAKAQEKSFDDISPNNNNHDGFFKGQNQTEFKYVPIPRVLITGFDDTETLKLLEIIESLPKCKVAKTMTSCTHLVTSEIKRTVKFLSSLNVCKVVVTKEWLLDSKYKNDNKVIKLNQENLDKYSLKDPTNEAHYKVNLKEVLKLKTTRSFNENFILSDYIIATTPNIKPNLDLLSPIILSAGGSILRKIPTTDEICRYSDSQRNIPGQKKLIILASYEDSSYLNSLSAKDGILLYGPEFILNSCLRQKLDFSINRIEVSGMS